MGIRYSINNSFFEKWSAQMAYVLGYIYADGNIHYSEKNRGWYLTIASIDRDIIEKIKTTLQSNHTISVVLPKEGDIRKKKYLLRIGSKHLYAQLQKRGVHPNKSLTLEVPTIPTSMVAHFVRGYFDGDGCVHLEKQAGRSSVRLRTILTSGSKQFLLTLEQLLRKTITIKKSTVHTSHRSFQLLYSTKDSIALFDFMYRNVYDGLYLSRKKEKFEKFLKA